MAIPANSISLSDFLARAILPDNRRELEHFIEALIHLTEQLDGDPDLEPWLAGIDGGPSDDREGDKREGPFGEGDAGVDDEPSLGWSDNETQNTSALVQGVSHEEGEADYLAWDGSRFAALVADDEPNAPRRRRDLGRSLSLGGRHVHPQG